MRAARENCWLAGLFGDARLLFISGKNCSWPQGVRQEPIACPLCLRFVRRPSNHATSCATDRVLQRWPRRRRISCRVTDGRCNSGGSSFAKPRSHTSASGHSITATGCDRSGRPRSQHSRNRLRVPQLRNGWDARGGCAGIRRRSRPRWARTTGQDCRLPLCW